MKYLDLAPLARIHSFLDHVDVGDQILYGSLEAYSCKLAGLDKKLGRSLEQEVAGGSSPSDLSMSPVGPLSEAASRKTLIYLILALNHIYPDYDFSQLRAHHFRKEADLGGAEQLLEARLCEAAKTWDATPGYGDGRLLDTLWAAIDEAVDLKASDVYSYQSDGETDPFGEAVNVWSFNFFFYNRKLKRILYLACRAVSKASGNSESQATENSSRYIYNEGDASDAEGGCGGTAEGGATDYGMAGTMEL